MKRVAAIAAGFLAGWLLASSSPGGDPEKRLEAAIHREIVLGDLRGAAEQFRALLNPPAGSRAVAARALLHLGQCMEKSGQKDEARRLYVRVVKDYGDLTAVAGRARSQLAGWDDAQPGPRNLTFERGVPGKVPPGWFVPAPPEDADYLAELRRSGCRSGIGCAVVLAPRNAPSPFGSLMQSFGAAGYRGKTVRLRAWLRVEAQALDDRGQMWLSVDRMSRRSDFLDSRNHRSVDSDEWTQCEIESPIDDDATFINFGIISFGKGRVWVDEVSFEAFPRPRR